jgi:hypothetical protein
MGFEIMRFHLHPRALIGVAIFATSILSAAFVLATPNDYRFELVQAPTPTTGR